VKTLTQTLLDDLAPLEAAFDEGIAQYNRGYDNSDGLALVTAGALILMADGMQRMMGLVNSYG
jgi:hypothetical protein